MVDTVQTTAQLLSLLRDGQIPGSLVPTFIREIALSSLNIMPAVVAANGITQATATSLTSQVNIVTNTAAGSGVIVTLAPGFTKVVNVTDGVCLVYPPFTATFGGLPGNIPLMVQPNCAMNIFMTTATQGYATTESDVTLVGARNVLSGVFIHDNTNLATNLPSWTTAVGRSPDFLLGFVNGQASWAALANVRALIAYYTVTRLPVCWSVSGIPDADGVTFLDQSAGGTFNSYYITLAQNLAAYPYKMPDGTQLIRIMWEFQTGFQWTVQSNASNTPANYISTWQNMVNAFRSVSNEFRFVWCPQAGATLANIGGSPGLCYPGDDYVDYIGVDGFQTPVATQSFAQQLSQNGFGIQWAYDYAQCNLGLRVGVPKPMIVGEWGVCNGGVAGTDAQAAQYITDSWNWVNGVDQGGLIRDIGYFCFWDGDAGSGYDSQLDNSPFPKPLSLAAYQAGFGGSDPVWQPNVTGTTAPGTPHRYWRLLLQTSTANPFAFAEAQFRTTPGVPLLFSGGTVSSSSHLLPSTNLAIDATDNNPATYWQAASGTAGEWWEYDFGSGNAQAIQEVALTAPNDANYPETPLTFLVQYSDDGSTWTSLWFAQTTVWTQGQTQTFTRP